MAEAIETVDTIIVGGGQSGLAMGYELHKTGQSFLILEASQRVGDAWRTRWDSLRLFTPGWYASLHGMSYPGPKGSTVTKDDMAGYLESYAAQLDLPVRTGVKVLRLSRSGDGFLLETTAGTIAAARVIVATGAFQLPKRPAFAGQLDPRIRQLHAGEYKNPSELQPGPVLLVGAGNSGSDISLDVAGSHKTYLSGRHPGNVPFRIDGAPTRHLIHVVRFLGHFLLNEGTPIGRKVLPKMKGRGTPVIRVKPKDILAAGIERVGRVAGVSGGLPQLEDGRLLEVANVIWCTGFRQDFSWIDLPVFDSEGSPIHERGIVTQAPGLYFVGLEFQYGVTSDVITGVGRDARYLAKHMLSHRRQPAREPVHA